MDVSSALFEAYIAFLVRQQFTKQATAFVQSLEGDKREAMLVAMRKLHKICALSANASSYSDAPSRNQNEPWFGICNLDKRTKAAEKKRLETLVRPSSAPEITTNYNARTSYAMHYDLMATIPVGRSRGVAFTATQRANVATIAHISDCAGHGKLCSTYKTQYKPSKNTALLRAPNEKHFFLNGNGLTTTLPSGLHGALPSKSKPSEDDPLWAQIKDVM